MNVSLLKIRKRRWTDNAYVERTHRTDDEEFYIPKLLEIDNPRDFVRYAWGYITFFNTKRPHYGKHMNELTPYEKLKQYILNIPQSICHLPPIIFDYVSSENVMLYEALGKELFETLGVHDVIDTYLPEFEKRCYALHSFTSTFLLLTPYSLLLAPHFSPLSDE